MLSRALQETVRTSCMVMVIVAGAVMFGHFLPITRIPFELAAWLAGLPLPAWVVIMLRSSCSTWSPGCFVDALALVLLTIPIFYPGGGETRLRPDLVRRDHRAGDADGRDLAAGGRERRTSSAASTATSRCRPCSAGIMPFLAALIVAALLLLVFPSIATVLPNLVLK